MNCASAACPISLLLLACLAALGTRAAGNDAPPTIEVVNHHSFPLRMPIRVRWSGPHVTGDNGSVQRVGDELVAVADVAAGARQRLAGQPEKAVSAVLVVTPAGSGVRLRHLGRDLGQLEWGLVVKPAKATDGAGGASEAPAAPEDYSAGFTPLALKFESVVKGAACEQWTAEAEQDGLRLRLELRAFGSGFLDIDAQVINHAAVRQTGVHAAVVACWTQPGIRSRTQCEDNHVVPLAVRDWSSFHRGEGRHRYAQRGVDWILTAFASGAGAVWLNDFAASFTVLDRTTRNTFRQARYCGANLPQLGQELQTAGDRLLSITELARPNIRSYRDRLVDNVLPARGEGVTFASRLVFAPAPPTEKDADQMFIGYAGYNEQRPTAAGVEVSLGTAAVRFGTSYFPYSTLGENFGAWKLPGMDRDGFWPLAADTVLRWPAFADDIRRDLRLIKAMGFQVVRLHYFQLLGAIPADVRQAYLDFLFGELRHVQLRALLDVFGTPEAIAGVVARYADVVEAVELENEILIWGIPLDRPAQWQQTYAAIKKVAPHVRVHLTGYNNTGIFNRLTALGVPYDRVGLHQYADSMEAIPGLRGYALALGSFASKAGKPGVITEWNWRGLTRMSPAARAAIYPPIFDNALSTRAVPEMFQFQFNETLAPNPYAGRGNLLRHYELVHLSRRPKLEAFEFMKLIRRYSDEHDPLRRWEVPPVTAELDRDGEGAVRLSITNHDSVPVRLHLTIETPAGLTATLKEAAEIVAESGVPVTVPLALKVARPVPGFYYCFVRMESAGQPVGYGWIQARLAGRPAVDVTTVSPVTYSPGLAPVFDGVGAAPCVVTYESNAPVPVVETAIAIAETLESAIGREVEALQLADLSEAQRTVGTQILVGTPQNDSAIAAAVAGLGSGPLVARVRVGGGLDRLVITGGNSDAIAQAGMDFLLRYWRFAKDSAVNRVGVEKKDLPRGLDPAKLP